MIGINKAGLFLLISGLCVISVSGCAYSSNVPAPDSVPLEPAAPVNAGFTGDQLAQSGKLYAAIEQYQLAVEGGEDTANNLFKIGILYRMMGDNAAAEESFTNALSLEPGHIPSREAMGLISLANDNTPMTEAMQNLAELESSRSREDIQLVQPLALNTASEQQAEDGANSDEVRRLAQVDVNTIRSIQARLNELGYNVGPADGSIGASTYHGIFRFKIDEGLAVNNSITPLFLDRLQVEPQ